MRVNNRLIICGSQDNCEPLYKTQSWPITDGQLAASKAQLHGNGKVEQVVGRMIVDRCRRWDLHNVVGGRRKGMLVFVRTCCCRDSSRLVMVLLGSRIIEFVSRTYKH